MKQRRLASRETASVLAGGVVLVTLAVVVAAILSTLRATDQCDPTSGAPTSVRGMATEEVILRATDGQLTWSQTAEILGRSPPVESSEWRSDTSRLIPVGTNMEPSGRTRQPATLRPMSDDAPKSAFELAMQRLQQKDKEANVGDRPLTDAQKAAIAEVRQVFTAKSAEREILHRAALRKAGTHEEVELLNENLRRDVERLVSDRDRKIGEIRGEASP